MYFINIKQLKEDIVNDKFSEGDTFIYFFVSFILNTILFEINNYIPAEEVVFLDYYISLIIIVVNITGVYLMYKGNGAEKGESFIERYISIIWVMSIILLLPLFIGFAFSIVIANFFIDITLEFNFLILSSVIFSLYMFLLYFYSYKHIVDINKRIKEKN